MVAGIHYQSYLVRVWYGAGRAETVPAPLPLSAEGTVPGWLERMLEIGRGEREPGAECDNRGVESNPVYAEVEHIQSGRQTCFQTVEALLQYLGGAASEPACRVGQH